MTMMRRSPLEELSALRRQINRVFEPVSINGNTLEYLIPAEVTENAEEYRVRMMLPGIEPKLISLTATQKEIVVEAEQSRELEKGENVCLSEFPIGTLKRCLTFPLTISPERIEASYKLGILSVKVPKTESTRSHTVDIRIST